MTKAAPGTQPWLDLVVEDIIDANRRIVDPHHHLWDRRTSTYVLEHLWADTETGHKVDKTVFIECHASYRPDGPEHLMPVGETEFVAAIAAASTAGPGATIAAIVAHADLAGEAVGEVLDAHEAAGNGLFRGIRDAGAHAVAPDELMIPGRAAADRYQSAAFRDGVNLLGRRGLTYDTWQYHYQLTEFRELAMACPDTLMVLDHFSTPLGVGRFAGKQAEIFDQWRLDFAAVAECPNVVAKLGGMAMPDNGFGWHNRETPATSDEFVAAQRPYYEHAIECFGAERCMLESNFPVDKFSISYPVLWNGLKKITAQYSEGEKEALFSGTASRVYKL